MATAEEFFLLSVSISFFFYSTAFLLGNRLHKILRNNTIDLYQ